jgi:uncharacterized membrane protein YhiD involved in acid resistance
MESLLLSFGAMKLEWHNVLLSLLIAFLCSSLIAVVYEKTFQGLSWSAGLLQTMVLGSMVACMVMIAIGDNIARGVGIVGSLAIIRFRTNLRDPRDLVFLFGAMGVGVASGVQSYATALLGTTLFCAASCGLHFTRFGKRRSSDGLVRFQVPSGPAASAEVGKIMGTLTRSFALVTMRPVAQGDFVDYTYQVKLGAAGEEERLLNDLQRIAGIRALAYVNQETTVEL